MPDTVDTVHRGVISSDRVTITRNIIFIERSANFFENRDSVKVSVNQRDN